MKITKTKHRTGAKAAIKIEFDTTKELDAFGTMLNCSPVVEAFEKMSGVSDVAFYEGMEKVGAYVHNTTTFIEKFLESPCFDKGYGCREMLLKRLDLP